MPITATPVAVKEICCEPLPGTPVTPTPVACEGQYVIAAKTSTTRGKPVLSRMQSLIIQGGQKATIRWQMKNQDGNPVDLRDCLCTSESSESSSSSTSCAYTVKFCLQEYLTMGRDSCDGGICTLEATVVTGEAEQGWVEVEIPATWTRRPGVFYGTMAVVGDTVDENGDAFEYVVFSNTFFIRIELGGWGNGRRGKGPPSIAEVRLHLRDSHASESYLLDNVRFDDAEINLATVRPIMQWNEMPPDVAQYTTQNFPFRYHWLEAIAGNLFLMVAEQFRANNLRYSAAGVSIDDQGKEPNYEAAAQRRLAVWNDFIKRKKAEINLSQGFASFGSPYGNYRY